MATRDEGDLLYGVVAGGEGCADAMAHLHTTKEFTVWSRQSVMLHTEG